MIDLDEEMAEEQRADLELLRNHVAQLRERFDTVQILCTRKQTGDKGSGTVQADSGAGNWYARYGQMELWLERERAVEWTMNFKRDDE